MTNWIKEIFWEDFKENITFFRKNFRKILKRVWHDSVLEIKESFKS